MKVGDAVGLVCFVSLALLPWWVMARGWSWWLLGAAAFWIVVGAAGTIRTEEFTRRGSTRNPTDSRKG